MQSIKNTILSRIYGHGRGWVFTPKSFADIADPNSASAMLGQFQKKGVIRRIAHGIYEYPRKHPKLGVLSPDINSVIAVFREREGIKCQPTGAYAANLLNLSEQVPAKVVFLTNGKSRKIQVGKITIELKKRSEKNMLLAGTVSGIIVEALKYLGEKNITPRHIDRLVSNLPEKEKKRIKRNLKYTPIWMRPFLLEIIGEKIDE